MSSEEQGEADGMAGIPIRSSNDAYVMGWERGARKVVHRHSSDPKFCGLKLTGRQWTADPTKITCPKCK